jgi:hypothetical protein
MHDHPRRRKSRVDRHVLPEKAHRLRNGARLRTHARPPSTSSSLANTRTGSPCSPSSSPLRLLSKRVEPSAYLLKTEFWLCAIPRKFQDNQPKSFLIEKLRPFYPMPAKRVHSCPSDQGRQRPQKTKPTLLPISKLPPSVQDTVRS